MSVPTRGERTTVEPRLRLIGGSQPQARVRGKPDRDADALKLLRAWTRAKERLALVRLSERMEPARSDGFRP